MRYEDRISPEPNTGCWLWTGAVASHGYGCVNSKPHGTSLAHRAVYQEHNSVRLSSSDLLLHSCDNSMCVNPSHLRVGTHSDNSKDRERRRRGHHTTKPNAQVRGARHGRRKLGIYEVMLARSMWACREFSQRQIAKEVGVSQTAVSDIVNFRTWSDIGGERRE